MAMTSDKMINVILVIVALGLSANAISRFVHSAVAQGDLSHVSDRVSA